MLMGLPVTLRSPVLDNRAATGGERRMLSVSFYARALERDWGWGGGGGVAFRSDSGGPWRHLF